MKTRKEQSTDWEQAYREREVIPMTISPADIEAYHATLATERAIQATRPGAVRWEVEADSGLRVACLAPDSAGAYRVAQSEHPGVTFRYARIVFG